jgi:hypothetical protein
VEPGSVPGWRNGRISAPSCAVKYPAISGFRCLLRQAIRYRVVFPPPHPAQGAKLPKSGQTAANSSEGRGEGELRIDANRVFHAAGDDLFEKNEMAVVLARFGRFLGGRKRWRRLRRRRDTENLRYRAELER